MTLAVGLPQPRICYWQGATYPDPPQIVAFSALSAPASAILRLGRAMLLLRCGSARIWPAQNLRSVILRAKNVTEQSLRSERLIPASLESHLALH
jgi:hypothetical protein